MATLSRIIRPLVQCAGMLCALLFDATRLLRLCLRSPAAVAAENLFLRTQLALYQERHIMPRRATTATRFTLVWLSPLFDWHPALAVVQPETCTRWRRQRFRLFWHWTSRPGRPPIPAERQALIGQMARDNLTWGQRHIANELRLKLGLWVSPRTVRKYMSTRFDRARGHRVPSQCWRTFVHNQACDLLVRGGYAELTQGVQAWSLWIIRRLQGWQGRCVTSRVQGVPTATDTGAMALLYDAASGLVVWSADAVDVRSVAERSPPAMALSCTPHHSTPARAAPMDTIVVRPAGATLDGWNRTGPHSQGAQPLCKGGTRSAPWQPVA
jgi:hypothetical protein